MSNDTFKWGIIGPGRIAQRFADGMTAVNDSEISAIASRSTERAQAFASKNNIARHYDNYLSLVQDQDIDAIYIATPHRFHYEQAKLCLEAGKHVLCEKPLTVNAQECQDLIDLAKHHKLFLMEAVWTRYLPIYQQIRQWLDNEVIGDIKLLSSTFGFNMPRSDNDRWLSHDAAGGALLDMGMYNVAISQWVMGEDPIKVQAMSHLGNTHVDEMTSANLLYSNNVVSQFTCAFTSLLTNDFFIYGSKGHIRISPMFWDCQQASLCLEGQTPQTVDLPFKASGFEYEIEEVINCIKAGLLESPITPLSDTLGNMKTMDIIRQQVGLKYRFE